MPGWVISSPLPAASVSTKSVSVPVALMVFSSSPVFRNSAVRTRLPVGTSTSELTGLLLLSEPAVGVMQPPVSQVERVAAGPRALREQDALGLGRLEVHRRGDRERTSANVDRDRLGHLGRSRVVDVAVTWLTWLWPHVRDDLEGGPVVERQPLVDPRVVPPQSLQLLELLGMLGGKVVSLGAVIGEVVELPLVQMELPPAGDRWMQCVREPAVVVERAHSEHRVELGLAPGRGRFGE